MTTNTRAARAVALLVPDITEARHFLDMLGLVDEAGRIAPDDTRTHSMGRPSAHPGVVKQPEIVKAWSTAPEALRVLAPAVKAAAIPKAKKVKSVAEGRPSRAKNGKPAAPIECGKVYGYRQHLKAGEHCQVCLDAHNAASRAYQARRRDANPATPPPARKKSSCGSTGGRRAHNRLKTPTCAACREADRVATAARRAAKRAA